MMYIYIDAAYNPTTQKAGLAMVTQYNGQQTFVKWTSENIANNHEAEFNCLYNALEWLAEHQVDGTIIIYSDSKIVVDAIEKHYVKDIYMDPWLQRVKVLMEQFSLLFIKWVPESQNRYADQLARQALQSISK